MADRTAGLPPLARALLHPRFYPHRPARVRLVQTHVSWVFLAGNRVYKVKKPVDFGFLDFTTAAKRARACAAEVALNRRLAPDLYLGVVKIHRQIPPAPPSSKGGGRPSLPSSQGGHRPFPPLAKGGEGGFSLSPSPGSRVVDHAVVMRRLPEERLLASLLARRAATAADLRRVARRVAAFHAAAAPAPPRWRRLGVLEGNLRENFRETLPFLDRTVSRGDYLLVFDYNRDFLARRRALLLRRARAGRVRDGHGDLHAGNVCLEGRRVTAYDCIEFAPRFRMGDVASDVAFLYMDLLHHRRPDLAAAFVEEYLARSGDWELRLLVPFYACYRAVVREKVESFRIADRAIPAAARRAAARRAAGYFRLARELARRDARPRLVLVGGLPGSGKSTVARAFAEAAGAEAIASDVVRKELAGAPPGARLAAAVGAGIYGAAMSELTYRELLLQAERLLRGGQTVVLDASFARKRDRRRAAALARAVGAAFVAAECRCPPGVARARLGERSRPGYAGASDAGWEVYRAMRGSFAAWPEAVRLDTAGPLERCLARLAAQAYPL